MPGFGSVRFGSVLCGLKVSTDLLSIEWVLKHLKQNCYKTRYVWVSVRSPHTICRECISEQGCSTDGFECKYLLNYEFELASEHMDDGTHGTGTHGSCSVRFRVRFGSVSISTCVCSRPIYIACPASVNIHYYAPRRWTTYMERKRKDNRMPMRSVR